MSTSQTAFTVLLIDDEKDALRLRKLVLENHGFKVLATSTPTEVLELFRLHDVDIVVTDHLLGRETAVALAYEMKRSKPYISIVSLSGTTNAEVALKYADEFVCKAEGPTPLIDVLDRLLAQKSRELRPSPIPGAEGPGDLPTLQALMAAIVEDSSDAILSKTLDGVVATWNHTAETMYGYTRDEMIGKSISLLLPPDRPDEVKHILSRLRRGERSIRTKALSRTDFSCPVFMTPRRDQSSVEDQALRALR
jgi:PAS domain S-box-containing protein